IAEQTGATVVAVDVDEESIRTARCQVTRGDVQYLVGDIREAVPAGPFDAIVLSNVLEHLRDRGALLAGLLAATQASRLLIRVPLFERDWRVPLKRELGVEWRLDPTHE